MKFLLLKTEVTDDMENVTNTNVESLCVLDCDEVHFRILGIEKYLLVNNLYSCGKLLTEIHGKYIPDEMFSYPMLHHVSNYILNNNFLTPKQEELIIGVLRDDINMALKLLSWGLLSTTPRIYEEIFRWVITTYHTPSVSNTSASYFASKLLLAAKNHEEPRILEEIMKGDKTRIFGVYINVLRKKRFPELTNYLKDIPEYRFQIENDLLTTD